MPRSTERQCQPLAENVPSASDPADALARIHTSDPDAGWVPDVQWPHAEGLPLAELKTSSSHLMLAQNYQTCANLFRLLGW